MPRARTPRTYLRVEARRRQLLDAAARLFDRSGYAGMTMVALAAEAGVSRRLVYDHFPDLASLFDAFFDDRTSRYLGMVDAARASGGDDPVAVFSGAFEQVLAMPADDQRVIRLLLADPGMPELARVRERFRDHVEQRWLPEWAGDEHTRALLWTMVNGVFGLADLVSRDEISAATASNVATLLVGAVRHAIPPATLS